ncbi:MAG: PQQ-binding-like beta-propeller repeat protein [Candidatus Omnitrophica bacterium]|nr:PQQ-binding-like beta-propeller repeat protein [Candidatus Omnitrophota bacterium]
MRSKVKVGIILSLFLLVIVWGVMRYRSAVVYEQACAFYSQMQAIEKDKIIEITKYITSNNYLDNHRAWQKAFSFSYDTLIKMKKFSKALSFPKEFKKLIDEVIGKKEDASLYLLQQAIHINNTPVLAAFPFYEKDKPNISSIKPYAEYIYIDNLKLRFTPNRLTKKSDMWYVNSDMIDDKAKIESFKNKDEIGQEKIPFSYKDSKKRFSSSWFYQLKEDKLSIPAAALRPWYRKYEKSPLDLVMYNSTVILRNEHRIYGLDLFSGQEIWSFRDERNDNAEYYQTFRHLHHNSFGYELLLDKDVIFTELEGLLLAVKFLGSNTPQLLWKRNLGEYTLCAKPIKVKEILVVGVINARGELWICGFDSKNGELQWNTYIGTSSFFSPVSMLSVAYGDNVILGTNHGVLLCLSVVDGTLLWLRKYQPKQFKLFDYWEQKYYLGRFTGKGYIKYDTQFMEIERPGVLYYKPRESEYFYMVDIENGALQEEIITNVNGSLMLNVLNNKAIFFKPLNSKKNASEILAIDLENGKCISSFKLRGKIFKGVTKNNNTIVFKISDTVYMLREEKGKIMCSKTGVTAPGWLLANENNLLFFGERETLRCIKLTQRDASNDFQKGPTSKFLAENKKVFAMLEKALQIDDKDKKKILISKINVLLSQADKFTIHPADFFSFLVANKETLKHPIWKEFISVLNKLFADQVVTYKDIEIKFSNFLYESKLLKKPNSEKRSLLLQSAFDNDKISPKIKARGEKIFLVPIDTQEGEGKVDFLLLLNNDQLICAEENGSIRWVRKVFYSPQILEINSSLDMHEGRMYADNIIAYLVNDTLVVNDSVNVLGINVGDGGYLWSITNQGPAFKDEKQSPELWKDSSMLFKRYGVKKSFVEKVKMHMQFIDGRLIIVHANKIYLVNPETGFCEQRRKLDIKGAMQVVAFDHLIYIVDSETNNVRIFDKVLRSIAQYPINFKDKESYCPKLIFHNKYVFVSEKSKIFVLNKTSGELINIIHLESIEDYYVEVNNDNLLVIVPLQSIRCFDLASNEFNEKWAYKQDAGLRLEAEVSSKTKPNFYFVLENRSIFFIYKNTDTYEAALIDIEIGEVKYETVLDGVKGRFFNMSNSQERKGSLYFSITTQRCHENDEKSELFKKAKRLPVWTHLIEVDYLKGEIMRNETIVAGASDYAFEKNVFTQTNANIFCSINGNLLYEFLPESDWQ